MDSLFTRAELQEGGLTILLRFSSSSLFSKKTCSFLGWNFSSQPFSMQNYFTISLTFSLVLHPPRCDSLQCWQNWFMGSVGRLGLAPSAVLRASSSSLWGGITLAWPASANSGWTLLRSLGFIHAHLEHRSLLPLTHILGSSAHLDLLSSHSLDPYSVCAPLFPFVS